MSCQQTMVFSCYIGIPFNQVYIYTSIVGTPKPDSPLLPCIKYILQQRNQRKKNVCNHQRFRLGGKTPEKQGYHCNALKADLWLSVGICLHGVCSEKAIECIKDSCRYWVCNVKPMQVL